MKAFMFPGQGSQKVGMGGDLFDEFSEYTAQADEILGYSIKDLCLEDKEEQLGHTQFTQPALYVVNALSYFKRLKDGEDKPDYVIGHSLGEFNALLAAECFDFATGLRLVQKRGELMSQASGGGMAAITNGSAEQIKQVLVDNELTDIDMANYNTLAQTVISGPKAAIEGCKDLFVEAGMKFHPLATSGAFHSRHMNESEQAFTAFLNEFEVSAPSIPVIANVTAKPYENDKLVDTLSSQISSSVRWVETVCYLKDVAKAQEAQMEFVEVGHGKVLAGLVKRIDRELRPKK